MIEFILFLELKEKNTNLHVHKNKLRSMRKGETETTLKAQLFSSWIWECQISLTLPREITESAIDELQGRAENSNDRTGVFFRCQRVDEATDWEALSAPCRSFGV